MPSREKSSLDVRRPGSLKEMSKRGGKKGDISLKKEKKGGPPAPYELCG